MDLVEAGKSEVAHPRDRRRQLGVVGDHCATPNVLKNFVAWKLNTSASP